MAALCPSGKGRWRRGTVRRRSVLALAALAACTLSAAAPAGTAGARMVSTKLGPHLCETTGGGRIVPIPGFPGERIDRRLLTDIRWLRRRYPIFITDGYSTDPVHAPNGEHPLGLAVDVVPHVAKGGTWQEITALARWAEPQQNEPRTPFRWVGYDGDSNHGRRHHLHLSWGHSVTRPGHLARTVYTLRCPRPAVPQPPPSGSPIPEPVEPPPEPGPEAATTGGTGAKPAPPVPETGGVSGP
jgi:hypothetical protein